MLINKIIKKIKYLFQKSFISEKTFEGWSKKKYTSSPKITFIIQSHNKSGPVIAIVEKLRKYPSSEIIVIDDGSDRKHSLRLIKKLNYANEFLLRSNDLYECITYDRAIYLSRGQYVVLLQDDDDFENLNWIDDAIAIFKKYPKLVILGGRNGHNFMPIEKDIHEEVGEYITNKNIGGRKNLFKFKIENIEKDSLKFVQTVNRAPMWIDRELFLKNLKNIDQSFAPFQWDDAEICLRAYKNNLHVGLYKAEFKIEDNSIGGMRLYNNKLRDRQDIINAKKIYQLYSKDFENIDKIILELNRNK